MEFHFSFALFMILSLLSGTIAFVRLLLVRYYETYKDYWGVSVYHARILWIHAIFQRLLIVVELFIFFVGVSLLIYSTTTSKWIMFLLSLFYIGTFVFLVGWRQICPISQGRIKELEEVLQGEIEAQQVPPIAPEEHEKRQRDLELAFGVAKKEEEK